ncbi:unnamed protein product [Coregonus sp. 'balchen']|nr:unnamed protein product [Coregonus sp. 'balchen']
MPGPHLLLVVVVAMCLINTAFGFANGKVSLACGDMMPQHGHDSSSKPAPYNITLDKPTFSPGDHITVTLLVVPMSGSTSFKGFLIEARDAENPDGPAVGSFSLLNPSESQLLHCGHTQGSAVSHTSKSKKTEIQALWEAPKNPPASIPGPVVFLNGATGVPPPNPTPTPTSTTAAVTTPLSVLTRPERTVLFELSGPADGYLSFALSLDKYMNVLSDTAWQLADGVIQCRFRRDILLPRQIASRFSLDQSYFLFIAHGRAGDGVIHRHDHQPLISTHQTVITGPPEDLAGSRSPLLIKFHGVFMLVAWMTTVTTGVIIARYFKHDWPETTLFGRRLWFQVHRALMILTVLLTCVGFSLPFIYRGGWSRHAGSHPYLGCTVMALSFIQPIMALLRPATDSSRCGHLPRYPAAGLASPWPLVHWCPGGLRSLGSPGRTLAEDEEKILGTHSDNERQRKVSRFRKIVFAVFLLGNVGFLSVLINTIRNV